MRQALKDFYRIFSLVFLFMLYYSSQQESVFAFLRVDESSLISQNQEKTMTQSNVFDYRFMLSMGLRGGWMEPEEPEAACIIPRMRLARGSTCGVEMRQAQEDRSKHFPKNGSLPPAPLAAPQMGEPKNIRWNTLLCVMGVGKWG
jgi:hypothetical protein